MDRLTTFEVYILAQPIPELDLSPLPDTDIAALWERAWILGYGEYIPRGEENLRKLAITAGILPASEEEKQELELAGF
jgi:hypothetical protein